MLQPIPEALIPSNRFRQKLLQEIHNHYHTNIGYHTSNCHNGRDYSQARYTSHCIQNTNNNCHSDRRENEGCHSNIDRDYIHNGKGQLVVIARSPLCNNFQ